MCPLSLLLALAVGAPPDEAAKIVIDDKLKLFGDRAAGDAARKIREIKDTFRIDLFVETTKDGPAATEKEKKEWFAWRKHAFRHHALDEFAAQRAEKLRSEGERRFDGIYVVLIDDGGKREAGIGAWPSSRGADSEVSWVKRDALRKALEGKGGQDNADQCLREFLTLFDAQQREIAEPPASPLGTREAVLVAGALAGAWLALLFLRWRANQSVAPGGPEPAAIYQPAMMGTLFGVPAAFWVNDELFRALPPQVAPGPARTDSFGLPPMPTFPPEPLTRPSGGEPFSMPPDPSDPPPTA